MSNSLTPIIKKRIVARTLVFMCLMIVLIAGSFSSCGESNQIVGQWQMTKVLIGEQEYDAATFLDPTKESDGTFVIQFYGDNTLIATGSLGTIKGASDGEWNKETENTFSLTIDGENRDVKLVGDLLFMDIVMKDATIAVIFERQ